MASQRFPKQTRLLTAKEFELVFSTRVSAGNSALVLYGAANDLGHPRLGLTVPRRIGGAVLRNRWKRLLREAFRLQQHELPAIDFVCVPRAASPPDLRQLMESFTSLTQRIERKLQAAAKATPLRSAARSSGHGPPAIDESQ
jgi:ribonuclease P protein component